MSNLEDGIKTAFKEGLLQRKKKLRTIIHKQIDAFGLRFDSNPSTQTLTLKTKIDSIALLVRVKIWGYSIEQ